jgi:threonine/homoserine/homoserine lactone efflux protein
MLPILLSVVVISLSGVIMPGLMFGVTLTKSLKSPWAGTQIALGHAVIEIPLILLVYFGFIRFSPNNAVQLVLSLLGGGMIIALGISMFRTRAELVRKGMDSPHNAFVAGIITSALNPFFWLWWVTIGTMLVMKFLDFGVAGLIVFIAVHWACDLVWLSFLSNVIYRTRTLWGQKFQEWLFIACSLLLVGFGSWYAISGILLVV